MDKKNVLEVLITQADLQPGAPFLVDPVHGESMSYRSLLDGAKRIASFCSAEGLTPGDHVGILGENGPDYVLWFLGLMAGGYVPVPLNVQLGGSDFLAVLDHSDVKALVVEASCHEKVGPFLKTHPEVNCWSLKEVDPAISSSSSFERPTNHSVAVLDYTSGSTGLPKGVQVTHEALIEGAWNTCRAHDLTTEDVSMCLLPLYHMNAQVITLLPTLVSGGTMVLPPRFEAARFWQWVAGSHCTWFALVPSMISQLLAYPKGFEDLPSDALEAVRFARSSSAALSQSHHTAFEKMFSLPLIEAMGATEAGSVIFSNPPPPAHHRNGSVGQPCGFEVKITNEHGVVLPPGRTGIISVRGPSMMLGYYQAPEATRSCLSEDGWLQLQDLGKVDDEGFVYLQGRKDELMIRGGENIAPREIDEALFQLPEIHEAATVGLKNDELGTQIVSCVSFKPGQFISEEEMLAFCRDTLGQLRTPDQIFVVQDFPRGAAGKISPAQVRKMVERLQDVAQGPAHSQEKISETLEQVWHEVLGVPSTDDENLFGLGGDSLAAVQIVTRVQQRLGITATITDMFLHPTRRDLSVALHNRVRDDGGPMPEIERGVDSFPLTSSQKRAWFLEKLHEDQPMHNEADLVRLKGALNLGAFQQACQRLGVDTDALRVAILEENGEPVQQIFPTVEVPLEVVDLRDLPQHLRLPEVRKRAASDVRKRFDLSRPPLARCILYRMEEEEAYFLLVVHHIISDRWSFGVLYRELSRHYEDCKTGRDASEIPEVPSFATLALAANQGAPADQRDADISYWKEQLAHVEMPISLPVDRPRKARFSHAGHRMEFEVPEHWLPAARTLAQRSSVTLFTVFAAGLTGLLHRYSGLREITLGLAVADRDRPMREHAVGYWVDTLVLKSTLEEDTSFLTHIHATHQVLKEMYRHRSVPFDELVGELHPERDLSHTPLFQVLLNWPQSDAGSENLRLESVSSEQIPVHNGTSKFDASWRFCDDGSAVHGSLEFSSDLFDESSAQRQVNHFHRLMHAAVMAPDMPVRSLEYRTDVEQGFSGSVQRDFPVRPTVQERIEAIAQRNPNAPAVSYQDVTLTYRELNQRASQVAVLLLEAGVKPDTPVGIAVPRGIDLPVALFAVVKAGGVCLPLDAGLPKKRLGHLVKDSGMNVLLESPGGAKVDPDYTGVRIDLTGIKDADGGGIACQPVDPSDLAYLLYTSGTTGVPKGVGVPHRALSNLIDWQIRESGEAVKTLQYASLSFDVSFQEFFSTWGGGGELVMIHEQVRADFPALIDRMIDEEIQRIFLPFVALERLTEYATTLGKRLPMLREIITAGEQLRVTPGVRTFFQRHPECTLRNQYGPTETHVVSQYILSGPADEWPALPPIGHPIQGITLELRDHWGNPVPVGVEAELWVAGEGLARGYLGQPELTSERFVEENGVRYYRTGDLCTYDADGVLHFIRRKDGQIKIRGHRVEVGEVEAQLDCFPEVSHVAVVVREGNNGSGQNQLIAYLVLQDPEIPVANVRDELRGCLPEYMIPSRFVVLQQMPLTATGKIDRKALPEPEQATGPHEDVVAPRTTSESRLHTIWLNVLRLDQVSVDVSFFDVGGDSLTAVSLIGEIEQTFGRSLHLAAVFESPTIEGLARKLDAAEMNGDAVRCLVPFRRQGNRPPLFCIHPLSGTVLRYSSLASRMGDDQPFYGFQARGFREGEVPHTSIEDMAQAYISEMREVQPTGPYYLCGMCLGGMIAFEMACQLEDQGEQVKLVGLLDSSFGSSAPPQHSFWYYARRSVTHFLNGNLVDVVKKTLAQSKREEKKQKKREANLKQAEEMAPHLARMTRVRVANGRARDQYMHGEYSGRLLYLWAAALPSHSVPAWEQVARQGIEVVEIPTNHATLVDEPAVELVANALRDAIGD